MTARPLALLLLALAAAPACRDRSGADRPAAASAHRYTVRGQIVTLPAPGAKARQIALRHEAIPDFADADGKVVGMGAMIMPFDVASGVALDGVSEGDPVEVDLSVDWSRPSLRIERLRELPAGTQLNFGKE